MPLSAEAKTCQHKELKERKDFPFIQTKLISAIRQEYYSDEYAEAPVSREYENVLEATKQFKQFVILGRPGAGKTLTLWYLVCDYSENFCDDPFQQPLPIFLQLSKIKQTQGLIEYLTMCSPWLNIAFEEALKERNVTLLLDGLNEVETTMRAKVRETLCKIITICKEYNKTLILTCRQLDYNGSLYFKELDQLVLKPLDAIQIRHFIKNYIKKDHDTDHLFWQLAGKHVKQLWSDFREEIIRHHWDIKDNFSTFFVARCLPKEVEWGYLNKNWDDWVKIRNHKDSLMQMASNPYILSMLIQVYMVIGELPPNPSKVLQIFINQLIEERAKVDEMLGNFLKEKLSILAYLMQSSQQCNTIDIAKVEEILGENLIVIAKAAGILIETKEISFFHQLFQEYFASVELEKKINLGLKASEIWPSDRWWLPQGWEETVSLMVGARTVNLREFLLWLRDSQPELAARCIRENPSQIANLQDFFEELKSVWTIWFLKASQQGKVFEAASLGRALGILGIDNRPGVGLDSSGLPDIEWCQVDAGEFYFGSNHSYDLLAEEHEPNIQLLYLPTFWIAKYPVTVMQFKAFLDAEDGFIESQWWQGLEISPHLREIPEINQDNPLNNPCDCVSWYEAVAFCRWLSYNKNYEHTLPTEMEWEKAARGTDGLIYPYGNRFDSTMGNTWPAGIRKSCAVGIFIRGISPYGVADMSGNVFEWCLSRWSYLFFSHTYKQINVNTDDIRLLKGGAWRSSEKYARAALRRPQLPNFRGVAYGFRCISHQEPL